jgi:alkanesulfonate monooxygenase SsuD/methylene tetrahydromethanopterin reductase-like flavin-dependent oxidoreductase (luciferase family)
MSATIHGQIGIATGIDIAPFSEPIRVAEDAVVVDFRSAGRVRLDVSDSTTGERRERCATAW